MTYILIFLTVAISIVCFKNRRLLERLALKPYAMFRQRQWGRLVTHGFVHADYTHLLVNMIVLWSFGSYVQQLFRMIWQSGRGIEPGLSYLLLYFGGMIAASLYDVFKYRDNPYYSSIGASGAVAAVVFTTIFYNPLGKIYFFGVLPIPGILFGILYLAYESYSARQGKGPVNHHAHIFGSLYGFIYPMLIGGLSQIHIFLNGLKF